MALAGTADASLAGVSRQIANRPFAGASRRARVRRTGRLLLASLGLCASIGCQANEPGGEPCSSTRYSMRMSTSGIERLDLLLVIDSSPSMADKQGMLAGAVSDLLRHLLNPPCVDTISGRLLADQPAGPQERCPPGSRRSLALFEDVHIGIVSSSIGGWGSDSCTAPLQNDRAHLVHRSGTEPTDPLVEGWNGKSFLAWDPIAGAPHHEPPPESDLERLSADLATMVGGVGSSGCRFEAPLEAWYRFLVDPNPHEGVVVENGSAKLVGTDMALLQQRAEFLRPDSMLLVVMVSDDDDCSIRDGSQFYYAAQQGDPHGTGPYHLPKPRAACATDPQDSCCRSCGQPPADGCDTSLDDCDSGPLDAIDDPIDLRCFDQQRRFGIDFRWPLDRYLTGLTEQQVQDRDGDVVPNPLFTDLDPSDDDATIRSEGMVLLTAIAGVPWQDIARRNHHGAPDLLLGLDQAGLPRGGFQSPPELEHNGGWDLLLGDPDGGVPPGDPLMVQSIDPRSGHNPVTGDPLAPPGAGPLNPINGSERLIAGRDDLQYACIFELPQPRDCSLPGTQRCDCSDPAVYSPLCSSEQPTLQLRAKAYPCPRQLALVRALGWQGALGSICPAQLDEPARPDWGYRSVLDGLVAPLMTSTGGGCLPRSLEPDPTGRVSCRMVEVRRAASCDCTLPGRRPVPLDDPFRRVVAEDPFVKMIEANCLCELAQLDGEPGEICRNDTAEVPLDTTGQRLSGWCYLDATLAPPVGNPQIVEHCPDPDKRTLRFVGGGEPIKGSTVFVSCVSGALSCPP